MKPNAFLTFFYIAFSSLFLFQGVWLYYAYIKKKLEIESTLESILLESIEKEMDYRFIELNSLRDQDPEPEEEYIEEEFRFIKFDIDYNELNQNGVTSQQHSFMQQILFFENIPFSLSSLDSIFSNLLTEENLPLHYQLLYTDSLGSIIQSTSEEIKRGYKSEIIHITEGFDVQAIIKIASPVILKNMLAILLVSILIFLLIAGCMIYLTNMFISQQHLNQLRENFTHALTHDMKTPLGTILTVMEQIKIGSLDNNPEMKNKFLEIGIEQTINLQAIINQILIVAYIDKKQLNLNKELIDLPLMIKTLIEKFAVTKRKRILFTEEYKLNNASVFADKLYLSNAISNLIDNAIKYSKDPVEIDIVCSAGDKQIYIRVIDNGLGISAKDQQKIFERFERGSEFKRNKVSGFGLGLSFVKAVIQAHGGAIAVYSQENKGSKFTITIPILENQEK